MKIYLGIPVLCFAFLACISACAPKKGGASLSGAQNIDSIAAILGREVDFNFSWKFDLSDSPDYTLKGYDDSHWRTLRLPHDWSVEHDFDENLDGATAYLPGGIGWYRKTFEVADLGRTHTLYFDGIYNHSEIWLNGEKIGGRVSGYTPFYYDISHLLRLDEKNVLSIRVDRSRYIDSRWYPGAGIYRDVKLFSTDKLHIPIWGTFVTTDNISKGQADVHLEVSVKNDYDDAKTARIVSKIISPNGELVARAESLIELAGKKTIKATQKFHLANPELWGLEHPNMYRIQSSVFYGSKQVDLVETPFGLRDIRFDPGKGFFLNGERTLIKGVNVHHDGGLVGVAVPDDVWRRRFQILKDAGVNAIRTAHNPMSESFLNICDEMGLLVQAEIFDEWDNPKDKRLNQQERHDDYISRGYADYFQEHAKADLTNAVLRDRNHPSVIMWSIGNEIEWTYPRYAKATGYFDMDASGNYFFNPPFISPEEIKKRFHESEEGEYVLADTAKKLSQWVKEIDTSRPIIANLILPSVSHITGYTDALDIIGYSYRRVIYDYGHRLFPGKMLMGTENVVQWHEWKAVIERDFIAGTFLWTGIDYLGEAHKGWPSKGVRSGMLDFAGFDKPSYHMMKTLWDSSPHVYLTTQNIEKSIYVLAESPGVLKEKELGSWKQRVWYWQDVNRHWNYEKNKDIAVEVYTNCDAVELFVNGVTQGVRQLSEAEDRILKWGLKYQDGELTARGLACDASDTLRTAGEPVKVVFTADKSSLEADGYAVAHVTAQLFDENDIPVRHKEKDITLNLSENLELLGVDSGYSATMERFQSTEVKTHQGRALAIIRAKDTKPALVNESGALRSNTLVLNQ